MTKFLVPIFVALTLVLTLFAVVNQPWKTNDIAFMDDSSPQPALAAPSEAMTVTLPLVTNRYPLNTVIGVQLHPVTSEDAFNLVTDAKTSWMRIQSLKWSSIEVNQGERNWDAMVDLDQTLIRAAQAGIKTILIVHSTPTWAQSELNAPCSRIQNEDLPAFASFLSDAVARYSKPPFNIEYWEIWNEPDVGYVPEMANAPFGCWGDYDDKYFGGGYYAQVLKYAYPAIKAADPSAKVLVGGLLLDCDPRGTVSYCNLVGHNEKPPKYLEGILINGGGNYFDGVSFHAYDYFPNYDPQFGRYSNDNWGASWNSTGPVSSLKAQYVREVLSKYGFGDKFILNTEAALICIDQTDPGCSTPQFEYTKAYYLAHAYGGAIKDNLTANIWYSLLGWRNSGLIYDDLTTRPAYSAYVTARTQLKDSQFTQEIYSYSGVRVLEYQHGKQTTWLAWSLDGANHTITLPSIPTYIHDFQGLSITPTQELEISLIPLYLDWYK